MKLENLKDFEWYNEPENVIFTDQQMKICVKPLTDFWQSLHHKISKDNGHFFYKRCQGDFVFGAKFCFENLSGFKQCGLMVRIDQRNWFKVSLMFEAKDKHIIGTCLTNCGYSDWAEVPLENETDEIYYKIKRKGDDFMAFYSLDGINFKKLRQFYLQNVQPEVKIGAYWCAPQNEGFEAVLDEIF